MPTKKQTMIGRSIQKFVIPEILRAVKSAIEDDAEEWGTYDEDQLVAVLEGYDGTWKVKVRDAQTDVVWVDVSLNYLISEFIGDLPSNFEDMDQEDESCERAHVESLATTLENHAKKLREMLKPKRRGHGEPS